MRQIAGDILFVNLTNGTWWREPVSKNVLLSYLGGRGINARILWDQVKPGTDPLGPENVLIFGPGLLSGTAAPSSGRTTVTCLSPATGLYLKTSGGGQWGAELKFAGFGYIVIFGRAEEPVYLWIDDEKIEIRDASKVWGLDVRETDLAIKKELGDADIQISSIGPAGEKLVRFAAVMFSVYHAAGRGGAGAVMGFKNLKAIAVRGSGSVAAAKPVLFHETAILARKNLLSDSAAQGLASYGTSGSLNGVNELRVFPAYNFQRSCVDDVYPLTGQYLVEKGYLQRRVACFGCVIGCHRYSTVERGVFAGSYAGGPEYETMSALGGGCGVMDTAAVIRANELCNIYGLDTISTGSVIQWAMECYEKGALGRKDLDGRELRWGDGEAVVRLVRQIAFREGFGDLLAEGVKRAAERVGGDTYKWAVHSKGLEQSRVDTRSAKSYALAFAVNPRGADHLHTETFAEFGLSPEARALIKTITGDEKYANPYITEKRAEIVRWHEDCYAVTDALGFCAFSTTALYGITPKLMADLFSAATGYNISEQEIMLAGRRIVTLEKCYNTRLGADRKDDTLAWRLMNERSPDRPDTIAINSTAELDQMLDEYYSLHGWDSATSRPKRSTLNSLGLADIAAELEMAGSIGKE
ncbi:MAG: aldehyde ferredoxin oxidoreductase family protein [Deltaproteobacteria bacterium]|nr:aldehyde ferredoxin oxidoreductase family protein [Deltaproteobacteria bacterium]